MFPIGNIRTPFREKFGIPSGGMRVASAQGVIELFPPYNDFNAVDGLEGASHLLIVILRPTWPGVIKSHGKKNARSCFKTP